MATTCTKCNSVLEPNAKFCPNCGQPVGSVTNCPSCNSAVELGAKFCLICGKPITPNQAQGSVPSISYAAANAQAPLGAFPPRMGTLTGTCPFCGTDTAPIMIRKDLTTNGWILFAVLLLVCFPVCWLPFVIDGCKKAEWQCPRCEQKRT